MGTLSLAEEQELVSQLGNRLIREESGIGNELFFSASVPLGSGTEPALSLPVLKSL